MGEVKFAPADKVEAISVIYCEKCPHKETVRAGWAYMCKRLNKRSHPGNFCRVSSKPVGSHGETRLHLFIDQEA